MKWRSIPGWEGFYEVSDDGEIRSITRRLLMKNPRGIVKPRTFKGRVLILSFSKCRYPQVRLSSPKKQQRMYVHDAVLLAFKGPKPKGHEACHNDDNPRNNNLKNLRYGTQKENLRDRFINGTIFRIKGQFRSLKSIS